MMRLVLIGHVAIKKAKGYSENAPVPAPLLRAHPLKSRRAPTT